MGGICAEIANCACDETDSNDGDGATVDDRKCLSADTTIDNEVNMQDLMTALANFGCTIEECGHPCGQLHDYQEGR